jgi:hypothetical protein
MRPGFLNFAAVTHRQMGREQHAKRGLVIMPKISSKQYGATITAARKAGGDEVQSHWEARLKATMKRRAKAAKKPITQ